MAPNQPPGGVGSIEAADAERLHASDKALLVDVREAWELQEARIDGALHVPLMQLQARVDELPRDATLIMVCKSGQRSLHAGHLLCQLGFKDVLNLAGGVVAWYQAGLPLTTGPE